MNESNTPAAGWYPDPKDPSNQRYWDGSKWGASPTGTPTPSSRPKRSWWKSNWRYLAVTIAGLIVGIAIGATGNDEETTTVTNTDRIVRTKIVPKIRTVTKTVEAPPDEAVAEAPAAESGSSGSSGDEVQTFSGNGGENLGNIEVPADSTLSWTNDGGIFQIFANEYEVLVNSQGHSGNTFLSAGTYSSMQTNAVGNWTITIEPE